MRRIDKSAIFLTLLGLFAIFEAREMGTGEFSEPGPGLFPLLAGLTILIFSLISLVGSILSKTPKSPEGTDREGRNALSVLYVLGILLVFRFILPVLGYIPTSFLTLVFLMKVVGGLRLLLTVVWSAIFTSASYILFARWIGVQFPRGILGF